MSVMFFLLLFKILNFLVNGVIFILFLSVLTGNALEMLCVNRFLFRKDNISVVL